MRRNSVRKTALAIVLISAHARAADYRALGGVDLLLSTSPSAGVATAAGEKPQPAPDLWDAELGLTLRFDARDLARRVDLKFDFRGREAFTGNATLNELWELNAVIKNLGGRVDLVVGRLRTPGGFWLVADGALLNVRYTNWLSQSVYGGLRAFTTGRRNTWMSDNPVALPLAGTSLAVGHPNVQATLGFTWSQDAIDLHRSFLAGRNTLERHFEDEYFFDGQVSITPSRNTWLAGGASLGTRYDVQFSSADPYGATTIGVDTIGAFGAWALAEYRPIRRLRLQYTFNFERVRLLQSHLLTLKPDGTPVAAADGSFEDHTLRAILLAWRALRIEAQYRLRFRENDDIEHHVVVGLRGDDLWRGLGAFASVGVDLNRLTAKVHDRVIYSGGLSYVRPFIDARAGILFTDGIGSGLLFSAASAQSTGQAPVALFPYVMETNRVAFVRVFANFWKMFAGLDVEEDIEDVQVRLLLQAGAAL
jgi:hypothetical protein